MAQKLATTIYQLTIFLEKLSERKLRQELNLGFAQFKVLRALNERQGTLQKEIAKTLNQTEASVSRQIKILNNMDLIDARVNILNRREREVLLTPLGKKTIIDALAIHDSVMGVVLGSLGYQEQKRLEQLVERLLTRAVSLNSK